MEEEEVRRGKTGPSRQEEDALKRMEDRAESFSGGNMMSLRDALLSRR